MGGGRGKWNPKRTEDKRKKYIYIFYKRKNKSRMKKRKKNDRKCELQVKRNENENENFNCKKCSQRKVGVERKGVKKREIAMGFGREGGRRIREF